MFLDVHRRRNPAFLEAVVELHRASRLPAGCYAIDLDAVEHNARLLATEGRRLGLDVFAMTKQVGRNPALMLGFTAQADPQSVVGAVLKQTLRELCSLKPMQEPTVIGPFRMKRAA